MAWSYLIAADHEARWQRVQAWFAQPAPAAVPQTVADLVALALDHLVAYAFRSSYRRHQDEATAAAFASVCRDELVAIVQHNETVTREVLNATMVWWTETQRGGPSPGELVTLLQRCADQMAAALVFTHLPCPRDLVWGVLLSRTAERVILARLPGPISEDRTQECITAMLERAPGFEYRGVPQAVTFFTRAYQLRTAQESSSPPEAAQAPPPTAPRLLPRGRDATWELFVALLGEDNAIKSWILGILREDRHQSYDAIVGLVLQPACGILDDDDLPPGVTWDVVQQAFHRMAQQSRSTPGTLTAGALRQFSSRSSRELARGVHAVLQLLLLSRQPWHNQPTLAWLFVAHPS